MIKDLNTTEKTRILSDNYIGRLAFIEGGKPYIIPITYYYDQANNTIISYASEGHKIFAMRKNDSVSLEVDEIKTVSNWQSVLVHGQFEELEGSEAKYQSHQFAEKVKEAISQKEKNTPQFISEFSSQIYSDGIPIVYRIKIDEISGKKRVD
jgi:nitroimidazol reductase NimA-like FMN-containing flavoprotein (pyridoxamine 5'-phosphate oxidase superfamily)